VLTINKKRTTGFGNLQPEPWDRHDGCMPHFPQAHTKTRSPRVRVPNEETIRFDIGGHVVTAVLCKISLTGGLAQFDRSLGDVTLAEARLSTASGPVCGLVEFLPPQKKTGPNCYPFRFLALSDADHRRLQSTLNVMRKLGLGE
jgi:hypothetical protein